MKKFKFSYNYKGVDKWVIIEASNEEDALSLIHISEPTRH